MFETELAFVDKIVDSIEANTSDYFEKILKTRPIVLREVSLGYGVADLVLATPTSNYQITEKLSRAAIAVLAIIERHKSISVGDVADRTGGTKKWTLNCLGALERQGLITVKEDVVLLARKMQLNEAPSIAIEAKLKNWKRALNQAYRYKCFANVSFVCIPEVNIAPAVAGLDQFKKLGVGLFSLNADNQAKFFYKPRQRRADNSQMRTELGLSMLSVAGSP